MLAAGLHKGIHFEVAMKDEIANNILHLVELFSLMAYGAPARENNLLDAGHITRILPIHSPIIILQIIT